MEIAETCGQLRLKDDLLIERCSFAHLESMTSAHSKRPHRSTLEFPSPNVVTRVVGQNELSKAGSRCIMEDDMILLAVPLYFRTQE